MEEINKPQKRTPYPYQVQGSEWMERMKRCINGDCCGTGKSIQTAITLERVGCTPALIVCPATLCINWAREIEMATNLRPLVLNDSCKATFPYLMGKMGLYDVAIVSYNSLRKYFVLKADKPYKLSNIVFMPTINLFKSVVMDEFHKCKSADTLQAKLCAGICHGKEYVFGLTGSPIMNEATDLISQLAILGRLSEFGGMRQFTDRYGEGQHLEELNKLLTEKCYFRREKKDVLKDLPDLTRSTIVTELPNREEYDTCCRDLRQYLQEYKQKTDAQIKRALRMKSLTTFMQLRAIATRGKVQAAISFLEDMPEQCVIFIEYHETADILKKAFPDAGLVTGRQSPKEKQAAIDDFQAGKIKFIICSIAAAGVGITLTAANHNLFLTLPWNWALYTQCESRTHRNGQRLPVTSWVMLGENSIDTYLWKLVNDKKSVASRITGEADDAFANEQYFEELIEMFLNN